MHSQNDEESVALKYVGHITNGSVFDIGAFDGQKNSNSLALIERGWKATLIEPSPWAFQKLLAFHHANKNVTLINCAIGHTGGFARFWECEGDQCSTLSEKNLARWSGEGRVFHEFWVRQATISDIIAQVGGGADVLSIDAEGLSCDILYSCPIGSWAPKLIILEHDDRVVESASWLKERGYMLCEGGLNAENLVMVRK